MSGAATSSAVYDPGAVDPTSSTIDAAGWPPPESTAASRRLTSGSFGTDQSTSTPLRSSVGNEPGRTTNGPDIGTGPAPRYVPTGASVPVPRPTSVEGEGGPLAAAVVASNRGLP